MSNNNNLSDRDIDRIARRMAINRYSDPYVRDAEKRAAYDFINMVEEQREKESTNSDYGVLGYIVVIAFIIIGYLIG